VAQNLPAAIDAWYTDMLLLISSICARSYCLRLASSLSCLANSLSFVRTAGLADLVLGGSSLR